MKEKDFKSLSVQEQKEKINEFISLTGSKHHPFKMGDEGSNPSGVII